MFAAVELTDKNLESKAAGFLSRIIFTASLRPLSLDSVFAHITHRHRILHTLAALKHWQYLQVWRTVSDFRE